MAATGAWALAVLLGRSAAVVFNLTTAASTCADALQARSPAGDRLLVDYHPLRGEYVADDCALSRADIAFTPADFLFLQSMKGQVMTARQLRRTPEEPDIAGLEHVLLPYNCVGSTAQVVFAVPFLDTPGAGCFPWPALLLQANNTAKGLLSFAGTNSSAVYYYLPRVVACSRAEIAATLGGATGAADPSALPAEVQPLNTNCATVWVDPAQTFLNGIGWNFCFWVLFCTLLFLGGYMVIAESEVAPDATQKDNWRTHYPPYSLHWTASLHYPKHARMVQLMTTWAGLVFFQALLVRVWPAAHPALRVLFVPLLAVLFAFPFSAATGLLLTRAYATNRAFVESMRGAESVEERQRAEEAWEHRQYRAYFLFYVAALLLVSAFLIAGIALLEGYDRRQQGWWMFGLILGAAWVLLAQDPLLALLAKSSPAAHRLLRLRGFWFDYDTAAQIDAYHLQ